MARSLKALLVLDYLIKNGSKQVVADARAHLPNIQTLTTYQHIDSNDSDVGQSGRVDYRRYGVISNGDMLILLS